MLVAAAYDKVAPSVTLVFDRAVDAAGLDGGQVVVDDGADLSLRWAATGPVTSGGPATVVIGLVEIGGSIGSATTLTASAATGIVAVDDGGTWGGVTDVGLPFP